MSEVARRRAPVPRAGAEDLDSAGEEATRALDLPPRRLLYGTGADHVVDLATSGPPWLDFDALTGDGGLSRRRDPPHRVLLLKPVDRRSTSSAAWEGVWAGEGAGDEKRGGGGSEEEGDTKRGGTRREAGGGGGGKKCDRWAPQVVVGMEYEIYRITGAGKFILYCKI
jgi:hypothetical protein